MSVSGMGTGEVQAELVGLAGQLAAGQCRSCSSAPTGLVIRQPAPPTSQHP
jgi:hypothetical protein